MDYYIDRSGAAILKPSEAETTSHALAFAQAEEAGETPPLSSLQQASQKLADAGIAHGINSKAITVQPINVSAFEKLGFQKRDPKPEELAAPVVMALS